MSEQAKDKNSYILKAGSERNRVHIDIKENPILWQNQTYLAHNVQRFTTKWVAQHQISIKKPTKEKDTWRGIGKVKLGQKLQTVPRNIPSINNRDTTHSQRHAHQRYTSWARKSGEKSKNYVRYIHTSHMPFAKSRAAENRNRTRKKNTQKHNTTLTAKENIS